MKGKARRLLSWVCVLALCMSLLPVTALASGGNGTGSSIASGTENNPITTDGSNGVTVKKYLTENGDGNYSLTMEAYVGGTVTPASTVPLDIVLVLDQSGSMAESFSGSNNRQAAMKQAVRSFIDQVAQRYTEKGNHQMSIVTFDSGAKTLVGWTNVDNNGAETLKDKISELPNSPSGATDVAAGMKKAQEQINNLNKVAGRQKVVIVFTDGVPTTSNRYDNETADSAVKTAKELKDAGVTVYTIGIFNGADPNQMYGTNESEGTPGEEGYSWKAQNVFGLGSQLETIEFNASNRFLNLLSSNYPEAESDGLNYEDIEIILYNYYRFTITENFDRGEGNYYLTASDANGLNNVFQDIAESISPAVEVDETSALTDTLSKYFNFGSIDTDESGTANDGVTVQKVKATGSGDAPTWSDEKEAVNATAIVRDNKISVTGFDYSDDENVVVKKNGNWQGYKLVVTFPITVDTIACLNDPQSNGQYPTNETSSDKAGLYYGKDLSDSTQLTESPTVLLGDLSANGTDVTVQVYVDGSPTPVTNPLNYISLERSYGADAKDTYFNYTVGTNGTITCDFDYDDTAENGGYDCVDIKVTLAQTEYMIQGITSYQSHGQSGTSNVIVNTDGTYTVDNVTHTDSGSPDVKIFLRTKYSVQYYRNDTPLKESYTDGSTYLAGEDVSASTEKNGYPKDSIPVLMNWKNEGYLTQISLKPLPEEEGLVVDGWFLGSATGAKYDPSSETPVNVSNVIDNADNNNVIKFYATSQAITPTITVSVTNGTATSGSNWNLASENDNVATDDFTVAYNGSAKITFEPQEGYALDSVKVNDNFVSFEKLDDGTYTFEDVTSNQSIAVVYALDENGDGIPDKHQATVTYQIENGTWSGGGNAAQNEVFTIAQYNPETGKWDSIPETLGDTIPKDMKPDEGFTGEGAWNTGISSETPVTQNVTYTYTFTDKQQYTITVEVVNGYASASGMDATDDGDNSIYRGTISVEYGGTVDINFQGHIGYALESVTVDEELIGVDQQAFASYQFKNITSDHTIKVVYEADTIGVEEGPDGIPDKHQATVTYRIVNGTWESGLSNDIVSVVTYEEYSEDGQWAPVEPVPTLAEDAPIPTGMRPDDTHIASGSWGDSVPNEATAITQNLTYTYTFGTLVNKDLTVTKTASVNGDPLDEGDTVQLGNDITYTITVTNIGNVPLSDVVITDTMWKGKVENITVSNDPTATIADGTYTIETLPAESGKDVVTITYTYTVTQDDVNNEKVTNTVTTSGTGIPDVPEATTETTVENPSLTVDKELTAVNDKAPGSSVSVGDTLTYTITVTNNGNVDLTGVSVKDTFNGKGTLNFAASDDYTATNNNDGTYTITLNSNLAVDNSVKITATYKVLRGDANGTLTNAVSVTGKTTDGTEIPTPGEDTEETPVNPYHPPIRPPEDPDKPELNTEDHYAYIVGYEDGTVQPEGDITRAEVATIFFRLLTDESRNEYWSQTNPYSDVSADDWFNNAVSTLTNAGVLDGYEDGTFKPNGNITRAEFATITARFFEATYDGENLFPDIEGHWAQDYINEAANAGIVNGYEDGTFRPQQYITRAEAVTMVNRTIERHPDADHLLDDMIVWPDNPETAWYYEQIQEATNSHEYTMNTDDEQNPYEIWTNLLPNRDWSELEKEWSDANDGAGSGEVV